MTTALSKLGDFDFRRKCDAENMQAPVFKLRPLTSMQKMAVIEEFRRDGNTASIRCALKYGLRGWDQLADAAGQPVAFIPAALEENLARLSMEALDELANAVFNASQVSEAERKN